MKINQAAVAVVSMRHSSPVLTNSLTGQWYVYDSLSRAQASVENLEQRSHLETADVVVVDRATFAELERASREEVELKRKAVQYDDCVSLANEHGMISVGRPAAALRAVIDGAKRNETYTSLLVEACVKYGYRGSTPVEMVEWLTGKLKGQVRKPDSGPPSADTRQVPDKQAFNFIVDALCGYGWTMRHAVQLANHTLQHQPTIAALDKDREAAVNRITAEIDKHRQAGNHSLALEYEQLLTTYLAR